jgi:hypothetical protein
MISNITVYYAGTEEEFKKLQDKFALASYGSGNPGIVNATYNYINTCEAFYGNNHQTADEVNDHNCTTDDVCRCGNIIASKTANAHAEVFEIVYTSYTANGTKAIGCSNEGCTAIDVTETLKPLFVTKGYSIKEDGYGITVGYDINIDALREYEEYVTANGKTFKLGIIMANATTFGDDFMVGGVLSNANGMQLELTSRDYVRVTAAIADFTTAEKDLKLVMSLYVIDDGKVSYVQHKGQGEYAGTVLNEAKTTALDIVTIQNIANLTGIDLKLPEPTVAIPAENKENQ